MHRIHSVLGKILYLTELFKKKNGGYIFHNLILIMNENMYLIVLSIKMAFASYSDVDIIQSVGTSVHF